MKKKTFKKGELVWLWWRTKDDDPFTVLDQPYKRFAIVLVANELLQVADISVQKYKILKRVPYTYLEHSNKV